LSECPRPLDPVDVEAVACGADPLVRPDAAAHAGQCRACGEAVRQAERLAGLLDASAAAATAPVPPDLADRVLRVRPFSRAERWSLVVWRAPLLLLGVLVASGAALVAGLAGAREQVGLAAALAATGGALLRAIMRWLVDLSRSAPSGLSALSESLRPTVGWAALLLLAPAALALRRVLARAFARR
jgi:hypothetical protein